MSESHNVLPVLVDLATALAGEDQTNDWIRTIRGGPSAARVFTPEQTGINNIALGTAVASNWLDVTGFRTLTAFFRITGSYGGSPFGVEMLASPAASGDTWGTDVQWAVGIAGRSGLTAVGNFVLANTGPGNYSSSTAWTGCIARKVRLDIGVVGASAQGWAYLICLP